MHAAEDPEYMTRLKAWLGQGIHGRNCESPEMVERRRIREGLMESELPQGCGPSWLDEMNRVRDGGTPVHDANEGGLTVPETGSDWDSWENEGVQEHPIDKAKEERGHPETTVACKGDDTECVGLNLPATPNSPLIPDGTAEAPLFPGLMATDLCVQKKDVVLGALLPEPWIRKGD